MRALSVGFRHTRLFTFCLKPCIDFSYCLPAATAGRQSKCCRFSNVHLSTCLHADKICTSWPIQPEVDNWTFEKAMFSAPVPVHNIQCVLARNPWVIKWFIPYRTLLVQLDLHFIVWLQMTSLRIRDVVPSISHKEQVQNDAHAYVQIS